MSVNRNMHVRELLSFCFLHKYHFAALRNCLLLGLNPTSRFHVCCTASATEQASSSANASVCTRSVILNEPLHEWKWWGRGSQAAQCVRNLFIESYPSFTNYLMIRVNEHLDWEPHFLHLLGEGKWMVNTKNGIHSLLTAEQSIMAIGLMNSPVPQQYS